MKQRADKQINNSRGEVVEASNLPTAFVNQSDRQVLKNNRTGR